MPLFKKIFFALFITAAGLSGVWAYFNLKNNKKPKVDALSVLPDSCLVYFSTADFFELNKKLNSQSLIVDKLKLFTDINQLCNTLRQFDSLFNSQPAIRDEINNNDLHLAVYGNGSSWLSAFNIKQLGQQEKVIEGLSSMLHAVETENNIYSFELRAKTRLYFTVNSGVVVISNTGEKIKEALKRNSPKLSEGKSFKAFSSTIEENSILSVYVNQQLYRRSEAVKKLNLPRICESGFYSGKVDIRPSELKINGYLQADSSTMISVFSDQASQDPEFIDHLPFACNFFEAYGFSNFQLIRSRLTGFEKPAEAAFWKTKNDSALFNLKDAFYSNIESHLTDFECGASRQKFVMVNVKDSAIANEHLKLLSDSVITLNNDRMYRLPGADGVSIFEPLSGCRARYALIYDMYLYFSHDRDDLQQLLFTLKGNLHIKQNASFNQYCGQNLSEQFNYLVYSIPSLDKTGRKAFFDFSTSSKADPFENFKHFSFAVRNFKNKMEFRWHLLNETETVNKEQNVLWALQLDTVCNTGAQAFVNHLTKENELLFQDEALQLYLINAKGTVLWKKKLSEKLSSRVYVVDIFKNNRYQMLFSSKNQLHLIDRNGNYLPGYPVELPAEASSPLALFDYDKTKDYRLFIACKNNRIYNYSITGKKQDGFVPVRTDDRVQLPVQYVKVGQSDYLVALDVEGRIYTFSRKGDGRIGLKNRVTANCPAFYIDATTNINSTYLIYVDDKNSLINKISFADKKEIIKMNYEVENADMTFLEGGAHTSAKIQITKLNAVIVYDINGNLLLSRQIDNDLAESILCEDESGSFFLARSKVRQELVVIDPLQSRTKLYQATALPLVSELFNDHKKYMVITNGARLSCASLN